jgi:hypothetical protein
MPATMAADSRLLGLCRRTHQKAESAISITYWSSLEREGWHWLPGRAERGLRELLPTLLRKVGHGDLTGHRFFGYGRDGLVFGLLERFQSCLSANMKCEHFPGRQIDALDAQNLRLRIGRTAATGLRPINPSSNAIAKGRVRILIVWFTALGARPPRKASAP